jgi:hypothetical protein
MIEAAGTSETWQISTRLHGAATQKTAITVMNPQVIQRAGIYYHAERLLLHKKDTSVSYELPDSAHVGTRHTSVFLRQPLTVRCRRLGFAVGLGYPSLLLFLEAHYYHLLPNPHLHETKLFSPCSVSE